MNPTTTLTWSKKYDRCLRCRTQERPHKAKGFCSRCYNYETENGQQSHITRKTRKLEKEIDIDDLLLSYKMLNMSLNDIAHTYNCTRQYIHKLMKKYEISRRDKSSARELAITKGKVVRKSEDGLGNKREVILQKKNINKNFFKSWSPSMSYVLGVLYTDGTLQPEAHYNNIKVPPRFIIFQKDPELLHKVLALMESNASLYYRKKRDIAGAGYSFYFADEDIYEDLLKLGLKPNKSLSLVFPNIIEPQFIRHFIRGCWDGDGTVYLENNDPAKPRASFISGSKPFVEGILKQLVNLGLPERKIYIDNRCRAFYFRFLGQDCVKLYHILYDGVPESMYLTRKYERFKAIADYFENQTCQATTLF